MHLLFTQRKVAESADLSSQLEQVKRDFTIAMNELQRLQMLLKNASQAIRTALQVHCNNYCIRPTMFALHSPDVTTYKQTVVLFEEAY